VEDNEGDSDNESEDSESPNIGKVYAVGPKGRVKPLSGGTDDYVALVEKQMRKLGLMPTGG
jgi:ATP-binding cassette, subfamily F, member 3